MLLQLTNIQVFLVMLMGIMLQTQQPLPGSLEATIFDALLTLTQTFVMVLGSGAVAMAAIKVHGKAKKKAGKARKLGGQCARFCNNLRKSKRTNAATVVPAPASDVQDPDTETGQFKAGAQKKKKTTTTRRSKKKKKRGNKVVPIGLGPAGPSTNAVLVQGYQKSAATAEEVVDGGSGSEALAAATRAFEEFAELDMNQDGSLSLAELPDLFRHLRVRDRDGDGYQARTRKYVAKYDVNRSGSLERQEFLQLYTDLAGKVSAKKKKGSKAVEEYLLPPSDL